MKAVFGTHGKPNKSKKVKTNLCNKNPALAKIELEDSDKNDRSSKYIQMSAYAAAIFTCLLKRNNIR